MKNKLIVLVVLILSINISVVSAEENTNLDKINEVMKVIQQYYKEDVNQDKLIDGAINGMLQGLDPYSVYLAKNEYDKMMESLGGEYLGVGIVVEKVDKYIQIADVFENSPAQKAGLRIGDKFINVYDKSVVDMDVDSFVTLVKGKKGTIVKLTIVRKNNKEPMVFEVVRDEIKLDSVKYEIINQDIGYIKIINFADNTGADFDKALKYFDNNKINKVAIDLRGNPGGYLSQAIDVSKKIIPKGPIVHISENNKPLKTYYSSLDSAKYKLALLVNSGSASAAEIVSGAVQDSKSGVLIGTQTYGKGTVQGFVQLSNGDYLKITIANYLTPNKRLIDGVGLTPDIKIQNVKEKEDYFQVNPFRTIKVGDRGNDVYAMELALYNLGYTYQEPNEIYDAKTSEGLIKFKKNHKLLNNNVVTVYIQKLLQTDVSKLDLQLNKAIEVLNK